MSTPAIFDLIRAGNQQKIIDFLLENGCSDNDIFHGSTPLDLCIGRAIVSELNRNPKWTEKESIELFRLFISGGCSIKKIQSEWVGISIRTGKNLISRFLIEQGCNIKAASLEMRPIDWAVYKANIPIIQLLLEKGADLDPFNRETLTPLEYARALYQHTISPKAPGSFFIPPKIDAVKMSRIIELLEAAGGPERAMAVSTSTGGKDNRWAKPTDASSAGTADFTKLMSSQYEWVVLGVRASIPEVHQILTRQQPNNPAITDVEPVTAGTHEQVESVITVVRATDSQWCIAYYDLFDYTAEGAGWVAEDAIVLSRELSCQTVIYMSEDISSAVGYTLYDDGKQVEKVECEPGNEKEMTFESSFRKKPKITDVEKFIDKLFKSHGIYIPACYPTKRDGKYVLAVDKASQGRIARADIIEVKR